MTSPPDARCGVPVLGRLTELLARFPEGPLPDDEIDVVRIGTGLGPTVIDVDLDDFEPDFDEDEDEALASERNTGLARVLAAALDDGDFEKLSADLRRMHADRYRNDIELPGAGIFALRTGRSRTVALHLLGTGTTQLELYCGLQLLAFDARDADFEWVRALGLLCSSLRQAAFAILGQADDVPSHLYWMVIRSAEQDRGDLLLDMLDLDFDMLASLPAAAPVGAAAELVLDLAEFESRPMAMLDDRRFCRPFLDAAEQARMLISDAASIDRLIRAWDALCCGRAAVLAFGPGERERAGEQLQTALASPEAVAAATRALDARPADPDGLWRLRQVRRAAGNEPETFQTGLAVRVTVAAPSRGEDIHANLLVDGVPLAEQHVPGGFPCSPEHVIHAAGLHAGHEPRTVEVANASCGGHGCCEPVTVQIRRDPASGRVEWTARSEARETVHWFDGDQYDAEIARAAADFTWEWPARRAARLLRERLTDEPELLARWECELQEVFVWPGEPGWYELIVCHPRRPGKPWSDEEWGQFRSRHELPDALEVDDAAVTASVGRVIADLRSNDPRSPGTWCGGSEALAKRLGYV